MIVCKKRNKEKVCEEKRLKSPPTDRAQVVAHKIESDANNFLMFFFFLACVCVCCKLFSQQIKLHFLFQSKLYFHVIQNEYT